MTHATLYIAAKAPRRGLAKTRLGRAIGDDAALQLYRAFLQDLAACFTRADTHPLTLGWYITPDDAWPELAPLVDLGAPPQVLTQGAGDWTERQRRLFRGAAARGEDRVILIASDSPQISVETITDSLRLLDQHELVLGPTYDGGYFLIGMRGWHDVLGTIPMSTSTVCARICARAAQLGLRVGLLAPTFDIDEAADLQRLRPLLTLGTDLRATRAALAALERGTAAVGGAHRIGGA